MEEEEDDELPLLSRTVRTTLPLEVELELLRSTVVLLPEPVLRLVLLFVVLRLTEEPLLELLPEVLRFTVEELLLLLFVRFTWELLEFEDEPLLLRFTVEELPLLLLLFVRFT